MLCPPGGKRPFFTERERAALAWTESVTLIGQDHAPDALFEEVRGHFNEDELVKLTMAIVAINSWNRLAIAFRAVPGSTSRKLCIPDLPGGWVGALRK